MTSLPRLTRRDSGFTLMEILVVVAIIMVLAAIAFPVFSTVKMRSNKAEAMNMMRQLTGASGSFAAQNDGSLPLEDGDPVLHRQMGGRPNTIHYHVVQPATPFPTTLDATPESAPHARVVAL
jgi:prepilin-type N-terminal cleavage/methylation domain-containing protein